MRNVCKLILEIVYNKGVSMKKIIFTVMAFIITGLISTAQVFASDSESVLELKNHSRRFGLELVATHPDNWKWEETAVGYAYKEKMDSTGMSAFSIIVEAAERDKGFWTEGQVKLVMDVMQKELSRIDSGTDNLFDIEKVYIDSIPTIKTTSSIRMRQGTDPMYIMSGPDGSPMYSISYIFMSNDKKVIIIGADSTSISPELAISLLKVYSSFLITPPPMSVLISL